MKVLFCAYDRPGHFATGPNAWIQRLVPDLIKIYFLQVQTLFIYNGDGEACPTISFFKSENLPLHIINRDELPYVEDQVKVLLQLVKLEGINVVVANLVVPAFYATFYLKKFNIPVIGVLHSYDEFYLGVIKKFILGNSKNQLTVAVSVSNYIQNLCSGINSSTRLEVISCGTPLPRIITDWSENSKLKVMYAGRIVKEAKQILKLTKAFIEASVKDSRLEFSIYGDGVSVKQMEELLKLFSHHQVSYKGSFLPSKIENCYLGHQVFTLMSDYEGMSVALMEAMAFGLVPVCLEEVSCVNELISHGINGFIVKDRTMDYQKHLKLLVDNPELWKRLSENAKRTIEDKYSTKVTHQQWFNLLQSFNKNQPKKIQIPIHICLEGELLYYGDNRKPSWIDRIKSQIRWSWLLIRMFIRPRARLKSLLEKP